MLERTQSGVRDLVRSVTGFDLQGAHKQQQEITPFLDSMRGSDGKLNMLNAVIGKDGGNFFAENKSWLIPLLLGGVGAGVGGGVGGAAGQGGMGAMLGGIGLPLIYMLMNDPEMLSKFTGMFGGGTTPAVTPGAGPAPGTVPKPGAGPAPGTVPATGQIGRMGIQPPTPNLSKPLGAPQPESLASMQQPLNDGAPNSLMPLTPASLPPLPTLNTNL